jgi:hypothetical protein
MSYNAVGPFLSLPMPRLGFEILTRLSRSLTDHRSALCCSARTFVRKRIERWATEVLPGGLTLAYHSKVIDFSLLGFTAFALCAPDSEPGGCNIWT